MTQNKINRKTIVQKKFTSISSVITCSTVMPADDTIPQKTEGDEVLTLAITPVSVSSLLEIEFVSVCAIDTASTNVQVALFQDATNDALKALSINMPSATECSTVNLKHIMFSGTLASTTFKIRIGPDANNAYVNSDSAGNRLMGGISATTLSITEYLQ